jgi:hypothetical protein
VARIETEFARIQGFPVTLVPQVFFNVLKDNKKMSIKKKFFNTV